MSLGTLPRRSWHIDDSRWCRQLFHMSVLKDLLLVLQVGSSLEREMAMTSKQAPQSVTSSYYAAWRVLSQPLRILAELLPSVFLSVSHSIAPCMQCHPLNFHPTAHSADSSQASFGERPMLQRKSKVRRQCPGVRATPRTSAVWQNRRLLESLLT